MSLPSSMPNVLGTARIDTSHLNFLIPSDSGSGSRSILLRGINLSSSSKYPNLSAKSHQEGRETSTVHEASNDVTHTTKSDSGRGKGRQSRDAKRRGQAGVDSSKGEEYGFWSDAEKGGEDGWFVNKPLDEEQADLHLTRMRSWGFNIIRLVITWEALEHAGPGKYDEEYIDYLIRLLRKCKSHGFRVFVSPHQDVFSRFVGGSGAPYWVIEAFGLSPRRIHQTGSAVLHSAWFKEGRGGLEGIEEAKKGEAGPYPDMIWNTNLHRLAARHCLTLFFASKQFAPKCKIDGLPAGEWARNHFNNAYGHLADRIRDAEGLLDECLIGWDSINEPHEGFIGIPDLSVIPPSQEFRKGCSPTPIQGFRLGVGEPVEDISLDDFGSFGLEQLGKVSITPPEGKGVWLTREEAIDAQKRWGYKWDEEWEFWDMAGDNGCPWAGHGLWNRNEGTLLKPDYFAKWENGRDYDFMTDFWRPYYASFISRIRKSHPQAISLIHPAIFERPPDLSENIKGGRMALSAHFYDGLTMLGKRRHKYNADTVGRARGQANLLTGMKLGTTAVRNNLRNQFAELSSDANNDEGMANPEVEEHAKQGKGAPGGYPTLIGELGSPWDMKPTKLFGLLKGKEHRGDYVEPAKSMDELLNGCDGENALSYTLWDYEPTNTHELGDGWNGEDLSLFSYDDIQGDDDDLEADDPKDLRQLMTLGTRGVESWSRPYPVAVNGVVKNFAFNMESAEFELEIEAGNKLLPPPADSAGQRGPATEEGTGKAVIYLPFVHYLRYPSSKDEGGQSRLIGRPGPDGDEWIKGQGPALIDIQVLDLSEGRLDAEGQLATWTYPMRRDSESRRLRLKIKRAGQKPLA